MFNDVYRNFYSEEKSKEYLGDMLGKLTNLKELELNVSKFSKISISIKFMKHFQQ